MGIAFKAPRTYSPAITMDLFSPVSPREVGLGLGLPDKIEEPYKPKVLMGNINPVSKYFVEKH